MMSTGSAERHRSPKGKGGSSDDDLHTVDLDDYLIVGTIENIYLHLEKIQSKLSSDKSFCPNYHLVKHDTNPLKPDMSQAGFKAKMYELMLCEDSSVVAMCYYIFTIVLILISLVSLVFEQQYPSDAWTVMEAIITFFFTAEYLATLFIVSDKFGFFCSASVFDILAVMPYYIELFITGDAKWILLVRLLRIARMNRIRQSPNPYVFLIGKTLGGVVSILSGIFVWLAIGSLIIGTFVHVLEEDTFGTVPIGMWFGLVTLTTVGYGDISPETNWGYIVGSFAIIFGLCLCSIVLQAVGQIYNDNIEILKDQMSEISQALYDQRLIVVKHGDDMHFRDGITFDAMIRCCLDDDNCYPMINQLLQAARDLSELHEETEFTYLELAELKEMVVGKDFAETKKAKAVSEAGKAGDKVSDEFDEANVSDGSKQKRGPGNVLPE